MRDHDEPAQAEEVGAAVRVGIETRAQPPRSGADEEPAEGSGRAGRDLLAQRVEQGANRPLDRLERDVAGEAVGDEDVGGALEDVAALGVAAEVELGGGEQLVRLERELVPLLRLLADREQPHARAGRCRGSPRRRPRPWSRTGAGARRGSRRSLRRRSGPTGPCGRGWARRSRAGALPGTRRSRTRPAASIAPVLPADTTASASPSATALTARTRELSSFVRNASAGFSSMPTTCVVGTSASPRVSRLRRAEDDGLDAVSACSERALDHRRGTTIAAHRVDGYPGHGIETLRSVDAERLDLAALVCAAGRADAVRALRLAARRADVDLRRADLVRRTPLVAARLRGFPLRDGHVGGPL